ncbi:unnamed protein product [Pedinophyceae sp. YPF-701]|nr:unnamed protein product [Pedinophyceae sp. YPF-701]
MVAPDTPDEQRPWNRNRGMTDIEFKKEVAAWGANEQLFSPATWDLYRGVLRADYSMFDEYEWTHPGWTMSVPVLAMYGSQDTRCTADLVDGWRRTTTGPFKLLRVAGPHLFALDPSHRAKWLSQCVQWLEAEAKL